MNKTEIYYNIEEIKNILKNHKVKKAYFFGSICNENFKEQSDVDFLISLDENLDPIQYGDYYFSLLNSLRTFLKRDIDLITEQSLKNPYFIKILNKTKQVIYE